MKKPKPKSTPTGPCDYPGCRTPWVFSWTDKGRARIVRCAEHTSFPDLKKETRP